MAPKLAWIKQSDGTLVGSYTGDPARAMNYIVIKQRAVGGYSLHVQGPYSQDFFGTAPNLSAAKRECQKRLEVWYRNR